MSSKGSFMIRVFSEVQRYCWQKISNIGGNHCETIGKSGGKIAERGCVLEESYFRKKDKELLQKLKEALCENEKSKKPKSKYDDEKKF